MNPDENQYPVDYLNQIAPQEKKPVVGKKMMIILIAGVILAAVTIVLVLSSLGSSGPTQNMQTLAARLETLKTISDKSQKSIKSGALRSTNSNLTLFLANTNRNIVEPLAKNDVDIKKIDKSITAKENGDELTKTLEDARLNAVFDRTYAREMAYQLETVVALMQAIYQSTSSKSLKDFLTAADNDLQPIKTQFADFNAVNG